MNYIKGNWYHTAILALALVLALLTYFFSGILQFVVCATSILVLAISIFLKAKYWRCPHCGHMLPWRTITIPVYCMQCGEKLDSED